MLLLCVFSGSLVFSSIWWMLNQPCLCGEGLICRICQFLWYENSLNGQFQSIYTMSASWQQNYLLISWFSDLFKAVVTHCCQHPSFHRTWVVWLSPLAQKKRNKDRKKQRPADASEDVPLAPAQSIDKSYLCCEHHKAMIAGLALLRNPEQLLGKK